MRIVNLVQIGLRALARQLTDAIDTLTVLIKVLALLYPLWEVRVQCRWSSRISWWRTYRHLVDQVFEHHGRFAPAATLLLSSSLLLVFVVLARLTALRTTLIDGVREQAALAHGQTHRLHAVFVAIGHGGLLDEALYASLLIFGRRYGGNEVIEMLVSATTI